MENSILNALTTCILDSTKKEPKVFTGVLFEKDDDNKVVDMIKQNWKTFFELAKRDEAINDAICKDIYDFYDKDANCIDYSRNEKIETSTYELFVKLLLLLIDDKIYIRKDDGSLYKGRKKLSLPEMIAQLKTRASFHDDYNICKDLVRYCDNFLDTTKEARNIKSHGFSVNGAIFQMYIEAFFVATFIYSKISSICAGFKAKSLEKFKNARYYDFVSMKVETLGTADDKPITIWSKLRVKIFNDEAIKIPVYAKYFKNTDILELRIRTYAFETQKESKIIKVSRGEFITENSVDTDKFHYSKKKKESNGVNDEVKALQNEIQNLRRKNKETDGIIDSLEQANTDLKKKETELVKYNAELKEQLQQQSNTASVVATNNNESANVVGIVHIKNIKTDSQCYLRINEGVNTYGTDPENGNHHQILLGLRGIDIKPKQFEIGKKGDRLFIRDLSNGGTLVNEQPIDSKGAYVTENTPVRAANDLEIYISKL